MWPELHVPMRPAPLRSIARCWDGRRSRKPAETAQYWWVNAGSSMGGLMPMQGDMWKGVPPHWMIYITVADCDEAREARRGDGGKVLRAADGLPTPAALR